MGRRGASGDLFGTPRPHPAGPGAMDFRSAVAQLLGEMFARSGLDRFEIAARASRVAGKDVTKFMLDAYTSEARELHNAPAWLMPALEVACNSHAYTQWLAEVRGARALIGDEALHHDLSRLERLREEADVAIRTLKSQMRGLR